MPSMGTGLEVKVLWELDRRDPSKTARRSAARTALKEAGSERHGATNRNRIGGDAEQGERARDREALAIKAQAA